MIKKGYSSILFVVEKDSRKEYNYEYNKKRIVGSGIEFGIYVILVRSFFIDVFRLIFIVYIVLIFYILYISDFI